MKITMIASNLGSNDKSRIPNAKQTKVACTLMSRDYKGLNNYGSNIIIETDCRKPWENEKRQVGTADGD